MPEFGPRRYAGRLTTLAATWRNWLLALALQSARIEAPITSLPSNTGKARALAKRKRAVAGGGGGLLALVAGVMLHGHFEPIKEVCDSGLGALGQAVDPSAKQHCSLDSFLAEVGLILMIGGAVMLAATVVIVAVLLVETQRQRS